MRRESDALGSASRQTRQAQQLAVTGELQLETAMDTGMGKVGLQASSWQTDLAPVATSQQYPVRTPLVYRQVEVGTHGDIQDQAGHGGILYGERFILAYNSPCAAPDSSRQVLPHCTSSRPLIVPP